MSIFFLKNSDIYILFYSQREKKNRFLLVFKFYRKKKSKVHVFNLNDNQHSTLFLVQEIKVDYDLLDVKSSKCYFLINLFSCLFIHFTNTVRVSALMALIFQWGRQTKPSTQNKIVASTIKEKNWRRNRELGMGGVLLNRLDGIVLRGGL